MKAALTIAALTVVMLAAMYLDKGTVQAEQEQYCDMVHLFRESKGDLGWPDYQQVYAQQCTPDGKLRQPL